MTLKELNQKLEHYSQKIDKVRVTLAAEESVKNKEMVKYCKNQIAEDTTKLKKFQRLLDHAVNYSADIKDQNTAVILYTTKQANLFLALERGVCRRISKGWYAGKQDWLLRLLSGNKNDREKALSILRFNLSKIEGVDVMDLKFDMIEEELNNKFWRF